MSDPRLSPLDAAFLAVETETAHMHVGWAARFDPPEDGPPPSFEVLRQHIADRLSRAPRCRQRVRQMPLGLGRPVWVDDPHFDIARHVVQVPAARLAEAVDSCMSEQLPRDRPLWQIQIADRLEEGRIGVVGKIHHCMVDGLAAVELASLMLDAVPDPAPIEPGQWSPRPGGGVLGAWASEAFDRVRDARRIASLPGELVGNPRRIVDYIDRAQRVGRAVADSVRPAIPVASLNPPISPLRHLGLLRRPMDDLMQIKGSFGVTLNDVVLAACAGGVRRFLRERGEDPVALKTMVPVSVRQDDALGAFGNRIAFMFVDLPCNEPDPVRRLRRIHAATADRKQLGGADGADAMLQSLGLAPGHVRGLLARLAATPRVFNLVASNIPGPTEPLYLHGCPLVDAYPVVPLSDRHALSIGMTSVGSWACFGLYVDRRALPDTTLLEADIDAAIDELAEAGERVPPHPKVAELIGVG